MLNEAFNIGSPHRAFSVLSNFECEDIKVSKPAHANVNFHSPLGVDGETLVGIDGNTEETWVSVDELILVPDDWVPQDTSIIKVCQAVKMGNVL